MLNRFFIVLVLAPLTIVLVALAVANRSFVSITFDPFNPGNPALTYSVPLFLLLIAALALGVLVGSGATWLRQGRYRKVARQRSIEADAERRRRAQELKHAPGHMLAKPDTTA